MTERTAIEKALLYLARRCDFASTWDGQGFNKFDAEFGHDLADQVEAGRELTDAQARAALKMLRKYHGQLEAAQIELPDELPEARSASESQNSRGNHAAKPQNPRTASLDGSEIVLKFGKADVKLRNRVKALPGRRFDWDTKSWIVDTAKLTNGAVDALGQILDDYDFAVDQAVDTALDRLSEKDLNPRQITLDGDLFIIEFPYDAAIKNALKKRIPGRRWAPKRPGKPWTAPIGSAKYVLDFARDFDFDVSREAQATAQDTADKTNALIELSEATDADVEVEDLGGDLFPFQRGGVAYALKAKRTFIADQMGLGKTIQALAALEAADAYPAVAVVPSSVKIKWGREAEKWLPGRKVLVIDGFPENNGNPDIDLEDYDIVVLNYAVFARWDEKAEEWVGGWITRLLDIDWKAVILDESHFVKNYQTQRTKGAKALCKGVEYRFFLTGTPIVNRPQELLSQLTAMGQIDKFGGFWTFAKRYCDAKQGQWGWDFSGAAHLDELNEKLRANCYIRRLKKDVLKELPAKRRAVVPLKIDNRAEYERVREDLVDWLRDRIEADEEFQAYLQTLDPKKRGWAAMMRLQDDKYKAEKAEHLVRIEALKQTAAKGKIAEAKAWIRDFVETGEKLVVFATHKDVVKAIADEFDAPRITGAQNAQQRQDAVDKFQNDPKTQVIVCNIRAGGVGITLTAASDVAFLELGWTPADHDQAEDRVHRIGQNDAVTAWYLVAADTIDEEIVKLLDQKRSVVDAATEGNGNGDDVEMLGELISDLLKKE